MSTLDYRVAAERCLERAYDALNRSPRDVQRAELELRFGLVAALVAIAHVLRERS